MLLLRSSCNPSLRAPFPRAVHPTPFPTGDARASEGYVCRVLDGDTLPWGFAVHRAHDGHRDRQGTGWVGDVDQQEATALRAHQAGCVEPPRSCARVPRGPRSHWTLQLSAVKRSAGHSPAPRRGSLGAGEERGGRALHTQKREREPAKRAPRGRQRQPSTGDH
eukprot:COSAG03_NODE_4634_length_1484_cov_26.575451_2_plen_164_part_00